MAECPRCANKVRDTARFCDACGLDLAKEAGFESELKYVTVLFGDVVNSTELIAGRSPEEAKAALTPAVNAMVAAVREFGGTVHSVLGDGVLALFGAPVSQEDHALRSCHAALRIQQSASALREEIRFRIGLASGPTLFSLQGGTAPGDLSAFGATIHLASRLQALARPGTTLCAETTRALAGRQVEMVALGQRALRGFGGTQEVFSLTGLSRAEPGFSPTLLRDLSPFVGRERELATLLDHARGFRAAVAPAPSDATASIAIVADAGTGKSRLALEAARELSKDGWAIFQVGAVSYGRDVPYQVLAGLIRAALGIDPRDLAMAPERVQMELTRLGADAALSPALLSLLGLPLGDAADKWDALDPLRRRLAIAEATRTVLDGIASRQPTLLVIDDLQWTDDESLKALDFVSEPGAGALLITTHRPDFAPNWQARRLSLIELPPLPPDSVSAMVRQAFPGLADVLRIPLIMRADGNPFFVEELARDALAMPAPSPSEAFSLPPTIQTVLASRVDRLATEDKRVALTAAALGTRFALRHLRALFRDVAEGRFREQLDRLSQSGILRPVDFGEESVTFSHALVQEVAYAGLPRDERRELHRRIVRALQDSGGNLQDQSETLVYHAARGELWEDLVNAARLAGKRAARQSAYVAAARFLQQAIDACRRLPRTQARMAEEVDLRFELRINLFPTDAIANSLANSTEAEWLARELGDLHRLGWATAYLARDLQLAGRPRDARATAARALTYAGDDHKLQTAARYFAAQAAYAMGDYTDAVTWINELVEMLEAVDPTAWTGTTGPAVVTFRVWLIWSLARLGRFDEALAASVRMRELADEFDLPLGKMLTLLSEGYALAHAGSLPEAEASLRASLALCRRWELSAWSNSITSCLGHVLARSGQFTEAFDMIGEAVVRRRKIGVLVNIAQELAWLSDAHRRAGEHQLAAEIADEAIVVARQQQERGNEALASFMRGESLRQLGQQAEAQACFSAALSLARESAMAPLEACCLQRLELERNANA